MIFKAGDGWDKKVDSALAVIKGVDPEKYSLIIESCDQVDFWISDFSSSYTDRNGVSTIYIANRDMKLNSINNIACVLVHESLHIHLRNIGIHGKITKEEEEYLCYLYEIEFLKKIPDVEFWLLENANKKINLNEKAVLNTGTTSD